MAQIFLSYRRSDSQYATRSISDRLQKTLGNDSLFQDVKTVRLGEDFEAQVNNILETCEVMLVIMGDEWLTVEEEGGGRRLDNPDDLVRREVAAALANNETCVIPVLTGDAEMPKPDELPDDLKALATRNAAVVRADASFESQMDALIEEIQHRVPELRPVVRFGKRGLIAAALVVVVAVAWTIYFNTRAPEDLYSITWSGVRNVIRDMEFGESAFQGIYLRTAEEAPTIAGPELKKYKLEINIEDAAQHEHEGAEAAGFEHAGQHDDLLKASLVYWDDLPEGQSTGGKEGAFLRFEAGKRYSTALLTISYVNRNDDVVASTEKELNILAPRPIEKAATDELNRVVDTVNDADLDDQTIRDEAYALLDADAVAFTLENGVGVSYNDVLSEDQRNVLAERIAKAEAAITIFERAEGYKSDSVSLADRRQIWREYVGAATALGRSASPQISTANAELADIDSFIENKMDVVEAAACTNVVDSDCVGPKTCWGPGESVRSWAMLKVVPSDATVVHQLVSVDSGQVAAAESTDIRRSSGYRSSKSLRADGAAGEFRVQVTYQDVVVSSHNICIGTCAACP